MNTIGILSPSSAYVAKANSVYSSASASTSTSAVQKKQDNSDVQNLSTNSQASGEINDEAVISDEAKSMWANDPTDKTPDISTTNLSDKVSSDKEKSETEAEPEPKVAGEKKELSPEQEQEVAQLKARDAEVKAHEQAHLAASAGISASAPSYTYETGPDGVKYAIGGEVNISFSQGNDPKENLANAEAMRAAALAPAQPSSQDLAVANNAQKMIEEAKQQIKEKAAEESQSTQTGEKTQKSEISSDSSIDSLSNPSDSTTNAITNTTENQPTVPPGLDYANKLSL